MPHGAASYAVAASLLIAVPWLGLPAEAPLIVLIVQQVQRHDSYPIGRAGRP